MEDNVMRNATETREDNNVGTVEMQDNWDGRQGQQRRRRRMRMVVEMRENRDIWRQRRCRTAIKEMWDNRYGEMGWKDGDGLVKYQHGPTTNLRAYHCSGIMGVAKKVIDEDIGGQACWRRCGTTGMDRAAESMRDGNIREVRRKRWRNELKGRRRTGKILTGNNYQPEGVLSFW